MKSYVQIESHFDHPDQSKRFGFSLVFDIMHVIEKGLGFIKAHSLNGSGSLIPGCGGFFGGRADLGCSRASWLVASSRPITFRASGRWDLAFFSHVARLSTVETSDWFPVAIRGSGFSFSSSECINFHFGFLIRGDVQCANVHSVRVSLSGWSGDSEESGQLSLLTDVLYFGQIVGRVGGISIFFNDFPDDGRVNVLLDDVDQLSLIELSGLTVGLELDDPFIDHHPSLFEFPKLLPSPILLIGWLEKFF